MTEQRPNHSLPQTNEGPIGNGQQDLSNNESLLKNVFWCVAITAVAAFVYALKVESSLFRAIALQLSLCGVAVWAALDAARIRLRLEDCDGESVLPLKREATAIHYLFVAAPLVAIIVFAGLSILGQLVEIAIPRSQQQVVGGAILAVLAASVWTVFARLLAQHSANECERSEVTAGLNESKLTSLLSALILMVATILPAIEGWFAWGLTLWTIAVASEHLIRVFAAWFRPTTVDTFVSPIQSLLREVFLTTVNPIAKIFDIAEARFGLSLRSSWTIRFFRNSILPITIGCLLAVWGSTCFVVIEPHQAGLKERFGVLQRTKLSPGIHTKLPWPFGDIRRYPANIVQTMQIGFEDESKVNVTEDVDRMLVWTKPHAQEFSLVLGSETELVAVNAIVYFKIAEEAEGFFDYALTTANPKTALEALAYRVLMEQTRSSTLADLLSRGRDQFAKDVRHRLSRYAAKEKLGLDIIDVALINLHPPVEVANSYLDVINAGLDSKRFVTVADGDAAQEILAARQGSNGRIANAKVDAAKRVSLAGQESAEFTAVGEAFGTAPETYRMRLWFEAFERVLGGRSLFIVDSELPNVIFDERARSVDPALIDSEQPRN